MRIDFPGFTVCAFRSGFSAVAFFAALVLGAPQPGAAQGAVPTTSALTGANSVNGGFNLGCRVVSNVVHGISSGPTGSIAFNDLTTGQSLATASLSSPSVSVSLPFVIPSAFSALPVIADFNNDGFDDIAYWEVHSDTGHNFVDVIYSNGDGTFQPPVQGPDFGSATVGSLVTGKFVSGDRLDLAVQYNNKIVILGSDFAVLTTITTGLSDPLSLVAADFNQDGNTDLAWIDSLGYLQVFLGKGDATFLALAPVQINPSNPGLNPGFAVAATLTSSGFPDLVFSHGTVLLGKGDGTFTTAQSLPTSVTSGWSVIATDLNGDTKQDVVISDGVHAAENDSISVLLGNGDGTFQPPVTYDSSLFTDSDVAWMVAGDFGDAGTDVVIGGRAGLTLFPGNGDGTFGAIQTWATASYAPTNGYEFQSLATGNFSGTGSPGLAGLGFSPSSLGRGFIVWPQSPHQWSASVSLSDVLFTSQFDAAHQVDCSYSGDANYAQSTSTAQSFSYQQAATPAFAPAAGTYPEPLTVRISEGASGAQIYYTVDGSTPTSSSTPYPAGGILVSSSVTVKAIAIGRGWTDSNVASAAYTIMAPPPSAAQPVITPVSGVYSSSQTVTITDSQSAATIHYTIDGSVPTASSPVYSGAFTVNASTVVKAIAVASGYSNSAPAWSAYNFEQQSTTATLTVTGPDPYTMSCSVSGRAINGVSGPSGTVRFTDGLTGATLGTASVGSGTRSRGFGKFPFALRPNDENIYDAVGDFNGDGIADVYRLMVPQVSSSALFYAGNGDGTFSAPVNAQSIGGGIPIPLVTGDFNGDGKLDVATIGNTLTVMLGNGDGTFQTPVVTPPPHHAERSVSGVPGEGKVQYWAFR